MADHLIHYRVFGVEHDGTLDFSIEYFACSNQSNFQAKFHEKVTSGNTGLIFSIIFISGISTDISRAEF